MSSSVRGWGCQLILQTPVSFDTQRTNVWFILQERWVKLIYSLWEKAHNLEWLVAEKGSNTRLRWRAPAYAQFSQPQFIHEAWVNRWHYVQVRCIMLVPYSYCNMHLYKHLCEMWIFWLWISMQLHIYAWNEWLDSNKMREYIYIYKWIHVYFDLS